MSFRNQIRQTKLQREAEGYLELGLPRQALDALARLGDPTEFEGHAFYLWGEALRELERYVEAVMPLTRAAEIEPNNVHVLFALGWCYKRTGQIDLAINSLEQVLVSKPAEPLVHYNLACYWSLAGDKSRALEFLAQALDIDPQFRELVDDEPDFDTMRQDPLFAALVQTPSVPEARMTNDE